MINNRNGEQISSCKGLKRRWGGKESDMATEVQNE